MRRKSARNQKQTEQAERFLEVLVLFPEIPIQEFDVSAFVPRKVDPRRDLEDLAVELRNAWNLGRDAIPSLAYTLEEHGVLIVTTTADPSKKFGGLSH